MEHLTAVFRAAVAMCGDATLAEDLTQTTFLKAMQAFETFHRGTNCKAWLVGILRNTWIDWLRRKKTAGREVSLDDIQLAAPAAEPATSWSNAADLLNNFSDEQVIRALGRLPDEQRMTLYLIDVEGLSYDEVARITEVPLGTVKSRTSHARQALRERLDEHARELGFPGRTQNAPE